VDIVRGYRATPTFPAQSKSINLTSLFSVIMTFGRRRSPKTYPASCKSLQLAFHRLGDLPRGTLQCVLQHLTFKILHHDHPESAIRRVTLEHPPGQSKRASERYSVRRLGDALPFAIRLCSIKVRGAVNDCTQDAGKDGLYRVREVTFAVING